MSERTLDVTHLIEGHRLRGLQIVTVAWLTLLMVLEGYDMQAMAFAAPALTRAWDISRVALGPVLSASLVGYMAGALLLSMASDRLGRKRIILFGVVIFGGFTLAAAYANSLTDFLVLRFLAGIGLGGAIPSGMALAVEYVPARMRGLTVALLFVGYTLGSAFGGFFAAWAIPHYGWPAIFVLGGAAPLLLALCLAFALPESLRFLALNPGEVERTKRIVRRLAPGEDLSIVSRYTVSDESHPGRSVTNLFSDGRTALTLILWFACIFSFMGHTFLNAWLPTVYADTGMSVEEAVTAGALFQLGAVVGCVIVGWLLDRWGIAAVAMVFFLAAPVVAVIGPSSLVGGALLPMVFLAGLLVLGGQIGLNALISTVYPTSIRAIGAGWALGIGRIGSISGPVIGGILIGSGVSEPVLFVLAALPMLIVGIALVVLLRRKDSGAAPIESAVTSPG